MNIGFIGVGHMAGSILKALAKKEDLIFYVNDHHQEKMEALAKQYPGRVIFSPLEAILSNCPYVFLGVKPGDLKGLLLEVRGQAKPLLISMAAGYSIKEMLETLGERPFVRIMPNTPVAVGKGVTFATYHAVGEGDKKVLRDIMSYAGAFYEIPEEKMDAVSVLTGSTPAYLDYFIDALATFGEKVGFSKEEATEYVLRMAEGTVALDLASEKSPIELGKEVCSPGGSTIEGVKVLIDKKMPEIVVEAAEASLAKTKKMK